jgi:hypothetical protein
MDLPFTKKAGPTLGALESAAKKLRARRDVRVQQLASAEAAIVERRNTYRKLLVSEDASDDALTKARAAVSDAELHARAIADAVAEIDAEIVKADAAIAEQVRRQAAERSAAEHRQNHKAFVTDEAAFVAHARKLVQSAERVSPISWAAREIMELARIVANEVPVAAQRVAGDIEWHIGVLLAGSKRPISAAPVLQKAVEPVIERRVVFSLDRLKWREGDEIKTVAKHQQFSPPVAVADRAVAMRRALEFSDPQVRSLSGGFAPAPAPSDCLDLDADGLQPSTPVFGADRYVVESGMRVTIGGTQNAGGG